MCERKIDNNLRHEFKRAVNHFWGAVQTNKDKGVIADAANEVFLIRDQLQGTALTNFDWDDITLIVADIGEYVEKHQLPVLSVPQHTSTGKKTYKILNKPSF